MPIYLLLIYAKAQRENWTHDEKRQARALVAATEARGLMIGRGAIRNPWVFAQIREAWTTGVVTTRPTAADLREYIERLDRETTHPHMTEAGHVGKMKKYLGYIAPGVNGTDAFWDELKLTLTLRDLFAVCDRHLLSAEAQV